MSRRVLIIILVVIGILAVCFIGAIAIGAGFLFQAVSGPNEAVNEYYEAVREGNWAEAHAVLAPELANQVTPQALQNAFEQEAATQGQIEGVSITNTSINNNQATVEVNVEREQSSGSLTISLVQVDDQWRIVEFSG